MAVHVDKYTTAFLVSTVSIAVDLGLASGCRRTILLVVHHNGLGDTIASGFMTPGSTVARSLAAPPR